MQNKAAPAVVNPRSSRARSFSRLQKCCHYKRLSMLQNVSMTQLLYRLRASARLKGAVPATRSWNGRSVRFLKALVVSGSSSWLTEISARDDREKGPPRASKA